MKLLSRFRGRNRADIEVVQDTSRETGPSMANLAPAMSPILPRFLFNEARYLELNADAAALVENGLIGAYEHYATVGHTEELAGKRTRSLPLQGRTLGATGFAEDALISRLVDAEVERSALLEAWDKHLHKIDSITFDMISEDIEESVLPPLDRRSCDESQLDPDQLFWKKNGYLIKDAFIPHDLIDRYCALRERHPLPGGWSCPVPYMHVAEIRDISLYPPLMKMMEKLIGEEMGLHLNLTGWVSTDRNWHQDDYLNSPFVNSWYAAVWVALDDIHPDSGPFEFVPGSHRWPLLRGHKVRMYMQPDERDKITWPSVAERLVNSVAENEIARRGIPTQKFIAKKGDVLIWHGRTMHRGSYANIPGMERRTLISHYTGLNHRNMRDIDRTPEGSAYYLHHLPLDWNPY